MKQLSLVVRYVFLTIISIAMIFPFFWMVSSSLKSFSELAALPPSILPEMWRFENYAIVFEKVPVARYFLNSLVVALAGTMLTLFTSTTVAFGCAFYEFKAKKLLLVLMLLTMCIPFEVLVITNYATVVRAGWMDSLIALILPFCGNLFYAYLLFSNFKNSSQSIYRASRVDGASKLHFLTRVLIPCSKSLLFSFGLFNFIASWNSFMWPVLIIKTANNRTMPFALYAFSTEGGEYFELMMAMSVVMVMPLVGLFFTFRKTITSETKRNPA